MRWIFYEMFLIKIPAYEILFQPEDAEIKLQRFNRYVRPIYSHAED